MRPKCPCYGCTDRKLLCHGQCRPYKEFKDELERMSAEKAKKDSATPVICRKVVKQIWRSMKR